MSNQVARQDESAPAFEALGDPQRRAIVRALRHGPLPVGELAAGLPIKRPAVSKHLKVLEGAGLVAHEAVGTRHLYALAPAALVPLQQWLVETWDGALRAFAEHVAATEPAPKEDR